MPKMLDAQQFSLDALRFILSLRNKKGFAELYKTGWYDNLLIEYTEGVLTIRVLAGDTELGHITYTSTMHNKIEKIEVSSISGFEGLELNFNGDGIAVVFNAARVFCKKHELVLSTKLVRVNKVKGSFEVAIQSFGTVFINYKLTATKSGHVGIHISNISASWNPMVSPRSALRVV